jgi:SAM-dependent methyltransferase
VTRGALGILGRLRWDVVSRIVRDMRPGTILEFGCGAGGFGVRLAGLAEYVGVEPDPASFELSRAAIVPAGGTVLNGTAADLSANSRYDLVCAFEVLEHLEDDKGILAEWAEFIRPGGHFLMSVPAWPHRFGPLDEQAGHFRRYTPEQVLDLLASAGLTDARVTLAGWPVGYGLDAVRNRRSARRSAGIRSTPIEQRTLASGRFFTPPPVLAAMVATPFRHLQRLRPTQGTSIVAVARRPR